MNLLKGLIKKYFSSFAYFYRYLGYRLIIVLLLGLVVGTLDAFGLTMFLPLLQLADGTGETTSGGLGQLSFLIDGLAALGINLTLWVALAMMAIFFILKGIATYFSEAYKVSTGQVFMSTIRLRLTELFTGYSYKNFVSSDVGRIQNTFTAEVNKVYLAYRYYSEGIQQIIMAFIYMVFVFMIDWNFALLVVLGGLIINVIYSFLLKKTKNESVRLSNQNSDYHKVIIQYITNFKYLKATGFLNFYAKKLKDDVVTIETTNRKIGMLNALVMGMREPVLIVIVCIVIVLKIYVLGGQLSSVLMSLLLFYRALTQLLNFQTSYSVFMANAGSLENITSFEKELQQAEEKDGKEVFTRFTSQISLQNVDFGYQADDLILKNINLTLPKNQSIAFVGESGSGKTTLVNVLNGLLPVTKGFFQVDNQEISKLQKETYQRRIGYIAQEPVIFNDTIFNNITFWEEPTKENIQRFEKAIEQASINDFIATLKEKEQTLLGNNGINLSGGQKQRISIARELYKDIDILILDEATSALDSETEKEIQYNIDQLKGKYTIIIIAHRLSTIRNVDKIYLMDKGEIVGEGSFAELTKNSEGFKRMVELQEI